MLVGRSSREAICAVKGEHRETEHKNAIILVYAETLCDLLNYESMRTQTS